MEPAEILAKAADVIETRGWHQGAFVDIDGAVCALGAIAVAAKLPVTWFSCASSASSGEACDVLEDWLFDHYGTFSVTRWNDAEDRTADQVVTALREAAKAAGGAS